MDLRGFNRITDELRSKQIYATVTPVPERNLNVEFITVQYNDPGLPQQVILNALHAAHLLHKEGEQHSTSGTGPKLDICSSTPTSLTFQDKGHPYPPLNYYGKT